MVVTDRVLMGPGPCNPYPEATAGLTRPMLGHLDPEFIGILDETCERLRTVWGTGNALTLPVSGTGSAGMEAAFVNTVGPGRRGGRRGQRPVRRAHVRRGRPLRGRGGPGRRARGGSRSTPTPCSRAHPSPKVIALVHAETSTGVRNDVAAVAAGKGDALLLADCVTSLGGIPVDIDGWGVDVAYSGTQKCLGVSPGLAPFTLGPRAWERRITDAAQLVSRPRHDRRLHVGRHPQVPPHRAGRHDHVAARRPGRRPRRGAAGRLGPPRRVRGGLAGRPPEDGPGAVGGRGAPAAAADHRPGPRRRRRRRRPAARCWQRYGIEIGGGVGPWAGRVWRIGCMGHTARLRNVTLLLAALAETLGR